MARSVNARTSSLKRCTLFRLGRIISTGIPEEPNTAPSSPAATELLVSGETIKLLPPEAIHLMEVDVGQQWGEDTPLRGAHLRLPDASFLHDPGLEEHPDQIQDV